MSESHHQLAGLRRHIARISGEGPARAEGLFRTGHDPLDASLGGGLGRGRLHEVFAGEGGDGGSSAGFAAMLALRARHRAAPVLWLRTDDAEKRGGRIYGPGFAELGGDPDALLLALAPDPLALLRGAADGARCDGLDVLVVECWGKCPAFDLTASRRLALAAEQSGVTVIVLRVDAVPMPSAADTRWSVSAAESVGLSANAPGPAVFEIELLRRRTGPSGLRWRVEWNRDQCLFREPALSGAVVPLPADGSAAAA